jgi:hypothetical protein
MTNKTVPRPSRDRPETDETTVSVVEAARILGISQDGVRKALRRGTLPGYKDARGVWLVSLPPHEMPRDPSETTETASRDGPETGLGALVDQLRSENAYLREELHNTHVLLAQLAARIPALAAGENAAPETNGDARTRAVDGQDGASGGARGVEPSTGSAPLRASQRPWWRRWLGGAWS